jgi:hypothetical protein
MMPNPVEALLAELAGRGVELRADGGRLSSRPPPAALPPDLAARLRAHKFELLSLLGGCTATSSSSDQAEAERLLANLRAEVEKIRSDFGGRLPKYVMTLLSDALVIGERFVRTLDFERSRGWDGLELLRGLLPLVREIVERWRAEQPSGTVWVTLPSGRIEQMDAAAIPPDARCWCREGDKEWTPHALELRAMLRYNRSIEDCEWARGASNWATKFGVW